MKKLILSSVALLPLAVMAQDAAKPLTIKGRLKSAPEGAYVYVIQPGGASNKVDSVAITRNSFTVMTEISEPKIIYVSIKVPGASNETRPATLQVFADPGTLNIDVRDSLLNANVRGSVSHNEWKALEKETAGLTKSMDSINQAAMAFMKEKNEAAIAPLRDRYFALNDQVLEKQTAFVKSHPDSYVSAYFLPRVVGTPIDFDKATPLYEGLSARIKESSGAKSFAKQMAIAEKTKLGNPAIEFSQKDADGKDISLASFKGKYVLIDFWASWCGPCRAENPTVVGAYNEYKDKGFTILGVSLDQQKAPWLKAIEDDKLAWSQVSDLKGWNNEVAAMYGVRSIPQNYLLDPSGKIIAKNLRGEDLKKKLDEIFKKG